MKTITILNDNMNIEQIISMLYNSQQSNNCGISEDEIRESEQRLNLTFPEIVRNYYLKFGNNQILNYNDELFRIQDIFLDEDYVVFCKKKGENKFYGIKIADLQQKNPLVYIKNSNGSAFTWHKSMKNHETLENFLKYLIVENSLNGGLKYKFSVCDFEAVEKVIMLIKNEKITIKKSNSLSMSNDDPVVYFNYYIDNHCAMHIVYISEKNGANLGVLHFASGDKNVYQKMIDILNSNGIKVVKDDKPAQDYTIFKWPFSKRGSIFVPGSYDNWRRRRKEAILVPEQAINFIYDLLLNTNADFDYYGISTEYSKERINYLVALLKDRVEEMTNNEKFMFHPVKKIMEYNDFYFQDNIDYRRYKKYILKMLRELITWLTSVIDEKITIIGV